MEKKFCPVMGTPCNETRVYEITENKDDISFTVRCCRKCAVSHINEMNRRDNPTLPDAIEFVKNIINDFNKSIPQSEVVIPIKMDDIPKKIVIVQGGLDKVCSCGSSIHDILSTGQIRCENCPAFYHEQMGEIIPEIKRINTPRKQEEVDPKKLMKDLAVERIEQLTEKMEAAKSIEDYESAALLRDQILKIKEKFNP